MITNKRHGRTWVMRLGQFGMTVTMTDGMSRTEFAHVIRTARHQLRFQANRVKQLNYARMSRSRRRSYMDD